MGLSTGVTLVNTLVNSCLSYELIRYGELLPSTLGQSTPQRKTPTGFRAWDKGLGFRPSLIRA